MINYQDAVTEGKDIVKRIDKDQYRLGEIADSLEPIYGDETLRRYADDIGINYKTLMNYRTTWRKWKDIENKPSFSVATALNRSKHKEVIMENEPDITVSEAIFAAKYEKDRKSNSKYQDTVIHKLVSRACKIINKFLEKDGELIKIIHEIASYNSVDFEYPHKVQLALHEARQRTDSAMEKLNIQKQAPTNAVVPFEEKSKNSRHREYSEKQKKVS